MGFPRWLGKANLLVGEYDISHTLKRHLNPFTLLDHVVNVLQSRYRLRCHANALVLVCSLTIDLGKLGDASTAISHLIQSVGFEQEDKCETYLVQGSLKVKAFQVTLYRLSIWCQTSAVEFLLLEPGFRTVAQ